MASFELTAEEARRIGVALGVDWDVVKFDPEELRIGIDHELRQARHGRTGLTDEDELAAFRAAIARLGERPDHYSRIEQQEAGLRAYSESL